MAAPMLHSANQRQYIKRVPAFIPSESFNKSASPNGSWRTLSLNSKSASTSSGYGTPKALQVDSFNRYIAPYQHVGSTSSRDTLVEDALVPGKKRRYNAIKQRPGEIWYQRSRDYSVPLDRRLSDCYPPTFLPRLDSRRKANVDRVWSFEKQQRYHKYALERYPRQSGKHHCDYQHNYSYYSDCGCHRHNYNASCNLIYLSSSSSESLREYDVDYSPVQAAYALSQSTKWKSEANLFVSTLDEEAAQIYNEILDVAGSLAAREQRERAAEKHLSDAAFNRRKPLQIYQSLYDLRNVDPRIESPSKATSRQIPKPLDRRRSRRSNQECTPTYRHPSTIAAEEPDIEAESALAVLEDVVNLDFLKPSRELLVKPKHSGSIPIIRAYLGETEDDWEEQEGLKLNGKANSTTISMIEVDESSDVEDKMPFAVIPLDDVETTLLTPIQALKIGASNQGSGSYSESTPPEDSNYVSDIDD